MRPTLALATLDSLAGPHRAGHRCTDGEWYNDATGRPPCPVRRDLGVVREQVEALHASVHEAAHDDDAARAVAEGMTGLVMADLDTESREGWTLTARMAVEALAAHLDRDPALEARAASVRARLAAAGLCTRKCEPDAPDPACPVDGQDQQ
jgi:hypothetical protein